MAVPVGSDLFTNSWNTVYKIISGNVLDPSSRGSPWIFADYPNVRDGKSLNHPGFPIITIEPFQSNTSNITHGIGKTYSDLNTVISVHTTNKRHVDVVSSDVWDALNSNREVLMESGLNHLAISINGVETFYTDAKNKIHTKNMGVNFKVFV